MAIRPASVHTAELLAALKVPATSPHAAVHLAYMTQVRAMILEATVVPTTAGAPSMAAGSYPVTGAGELE